MKNKIIFGIASIFLIVNMLLVAGLNYNVEYSETSDNRLVSINSIYSFLESIEGNDNTMGVYYDSILDKTAIEDFATYFNMQARNQAYISQEYNWTVYMGDLNSSFIDSEIRELISIDDYYDAALFHSIEDGESLYVVVKNNSILESLLNNLKEYYVWSDELFYENIVYYSLEEGFTRSEVIECNTREETDSGDNPNEAGNLDNGEDWMSDTCFDKTLVEFFCQENISLMKAYDCQYGCKNGKCLDCKRGYLSEFQCQCTQAQLQQEYQDKKTGISSWKNIKSFKTSEQCSQALENPGKNGKKTKTGYLDNFQCTCTQARLQQEYQSWNKRTLECAGTWKNIKSFKTSEQCEQALENPSSYGKRTVTGQVVSGSDFNIFGKIADFFRNLFD